MAPLALLTLLLAAANANMMNTGEMARMKRILKSPVTERMASELGLNIPQLPDYDFMANIENLDINEVATQAAATGCLPEGTQFSEETSTAVRECVKQAYDEVKSNPLGRRRPTRRRGRSLINRIKENAAKRAMGLMWTCLSERLNLAADDGTLNQAGVDAVIDGSTMPDELKTHKKNMSRICVEETPAELSGAEALKFQLKCLSEMNGLDCAIGMAYTVSPTVGFLAVHGAGKCMCKGAMPPPRAVQAYAACMGDGLSGFARERLAATRAGRRRRDTEMMEAWNKMGGLEDIEKALGAAPSKPCRPTIFRKCPKPAQRTEEILAKIDEFLPRAEAIMGPLDEAFNSVPARAANVTSCWFNEMDAVNADGSVNIDTVREIASQYTREDSEEDAAMQEISSRIIDICSESSSSVDEFTECWSISAAYGCRLFDAIEETQEKQQKLQEQQRSSSNKPRFTWRG